MVPVHALQGRGSEEEAFNLATKFDKQRLVFVATLRKKLVKDLVGGGAGESKDGAKMRKRRRR